MHTLDASKQPLQPTLTISMGARGRLTETYPYQPASQTSRSRETQSRQTTLHARLPLTGNASQ